MHINTVGNILILLGALIFLGVAVADGLGFDHGSMAMGLVTHD